jgi:hypothetical protein
MTKIGIQPGLFGHLFLSVGAMKAGTTWLYSVLEKHPELHFTPEKELHYFYHRYVDDRQLSDRRRLTLAKDRYLDPFDPARANPDRVRLNLHWVANYLQRPVDDLWYRNLFTRLRGETYNCDFSNLYTHLPQEAWPRIHADCTKLRVIYTMRHPVKRLWSHVKFHLQITGKIDALSDWSPRQIHDFAKLPFIWDNAEYGAALRRMKAGLPQECLLPVFYEDMRSDPRGVLARIEDFLEIPHHTYDEVLLSQKVNASASIEMPAHFGEMFKDDFARIMDEVRAEGLQPPDSWIA